MSETHLFSGTSAPIRLLLPEGQNPAWLGAELEKALGAKVHIETYADDAAAEKTVIAGMCDLASISDRAAADLVPKKTLRSLPVLAGLPAPEPEFLHHYYDPTSACTWPYGWSLLGWATTLHGADAPQSWKDLDKEGLSFSLPADPELRRALWALAQDKPPAEAGDLPAAWQKAVAVDAAVRVDFLWKLRARAGEQLVLPAKGSLIAMYHWVLPAATADSARGEAVLRLLAAPALAARFDAECGLAATQAETRALFPAALQTNPLLYPAPPLRNQCRFVR